MLNEGFKSSLNHMRTLWGATLSMESLGGSERKRMACIACASATAGKSSAKKKAAGKAIRNILRVMEECMRVLISLILTSHWDLQARYW